MSLKYIRLFLNLLSALDYQLYPYIVFHNIHPFLLVFRKYPLHAEPDRSVRFV